jgi:hypothetical protein
MPDEVTPMATAFYSGSSGFELAGSVTGGELRDAEDVFRSKPRVRGLAARLRLKNRARSSGIPSTLGIWNSIPTPNRWARGHRANFIPSG